MYFYDRLNKQTYVLTGKSNETHSIENIYNNLGPKHSEALLGFYIFTGCDQIGRFNGKSKTACWNVFCTAEKPILDAFCALGCDNFEENSSNILHLESFVVKLYMNKKEGRNHPVKNLKEARWTLFSRYQQGVEKLPPTARTLYFKILRSHFVTTIVKKADISFPQYPDPILYGWKKLDNGDMKPIIKEFTELIMCQCHCRKKNKMPL